MIGATLERFGRVDVLVNNAGISRSGAFAGVTLGSWRAVMAGMTTYNAAKGAVVNLTRSLAASLRHKGSRERGRSVADHVRGRRDRPSWPVVTRGSWPASCYLSMVVARGQWPAPHR